MLSMQSMSTPTFKSLIQVTTTMSSMLSQRTSGRNPAQTLLVALEQSMEYLCGYTSLQKRILPRPGAVLENSSVGTSTSLVSTAKQFAIPEVNFWTYQLSIQYLHPIVWHSKVCLSLLDWKAEFLRRGCVCLETLHTLTRSTWPHLLLQSLVEAKIHIISIIHSSMSGLSARLEC